MSSARTASRLTRILTMLPWVIAHPGTTVTDVCTRFGYRDERQLAQDLDMVFVCGLPGYGPGDLMVAYIEDDEVVVDTADYFEGAPRLTPTETLSMLASAMAVIASGQASPALESAVDKLAASVAPDGETALAVDVAAEPSLVGPLREAAGSNRVVEIVYTSLAKGDTTERSVEPWTVFTAMGNWYLTGYCRLAQAERVFRVDRIRRVEISEEAFEPPPRTPEPEVHYVASDEDARCVIELSPRARWVLDYYPVDVLSDDSNGLVVEFAAADPSVAARLLLRLGEQAILAEGSEVAEALDELRSRILARYR